MDIFNRFQDDGYKNWMKTNMGLQRLKTRLEPFLENETETYHRFLCNTLKLKAECQTKCKLKNGYKTINKVPIVCDVCEPWRDEIWKNHTNHGAQVYWNNCTPHLWSTEKWEVAKVYMPRGNTNHRTVGQFDISAFLNFMTFCKHFKFVNNTFITKVTHVRNQVMHSPDWSVQRADLETHLQHIKHLGKVLEERDPQLKALALDIDQLQNTDFDLIAKYAYVAVAQGPDTDGKLETLYELIGKSNEFLREEHQILKDWMENMVRRYEEDRENSLTPEELQNVRAFLSGNQDLEQWLAPQWKRLTEVQERVELHGRQIHTLTDRVGTLEQSVQAPDPELRTEVLMYKNNLFEKAKKRGWADPIFSEIMSGSGKKGCVTVNGQEFIGSRFYLNTKMAHQEVAKLALEQLSNHSADDLVQQANEKGEASNSQTEQPASLSNPGSIFFGSVTVHVTHVICEEGHAGKAEAVESAYKKLAALLCVDLSQSASSYQEAVQQHCQRREVPPPEQNSQDSSCTLTFTGPITFHDSEGASKKRQAHHQAARVALGVLSGVLGKQEVWKENYIGALKELLDARGWSQARYGVAEGSGGGGAKVEEETGESETTWTSAEDSGDGAPMDTGPVSTETAVPMETEATPTQPEERSVAGNSRKYLGCVKVEVRKELAPQEASSQEEAAQAAYSSLVQTLSLDPTTTAGGAREGVQEFFRQAECCPPVEDSVLTAEGKHRCILGIAGQLTFHTQEGSSKKQQAEHLAAKEALKHLEGLLGGNLRGAGENYKGRLQELLVKHGGGAKAQYSNTEAQNTATGARVGGAGTDRRPPGAPAGRQAPSPMDTAPVSTDTAAPVETRATPTQPEERSVSGNSRKYLGCVKVEVRKELAPHEASSQEEAAQAAYSSLVQTLSLDPTTTAGGARQGVQEFFRQAECCPPVEDSVLTAEGKHRCILGIAGQLTFHTQEGSSKKQQAEQLAAKEALKHLEGLLGGNIRGAGENYKGRLQELLVKHGGGAKAQYSTTEAQNTATDPCQVSSAVTGSTLQAEVPSVKGAVATETAPEGLNSSPKHIAEMESERQKKEIQRCVELLGLGAVCEEVTEEQSHTWRVSVALERFALRNQERSSSREEAVSRSYLRLGLAAQVCQPGADAKEPKKAVLMFLSQGAFPEPVEAVDQLEDGTFSCSLSDITCVFSYQGEGSSEAAAHVSSLQRALSRLSPLLVSCAPVSLPGSVEEAEPRLRALLELRDGLRLSGSAPSGTLYKNSVQLSFTGFGVESQGEHSKKETRAKLSQRLLGLLGEVTTSSTSVRNVLDQWFLRNGLEKPVFEQTDDGFGTRVTFSAAVNFSTGWKDSRPAAQSAAMEELLRRIRHLSHAEMTDQ